MKGNEGNKLLVGLNPEQLKAVKHGEGPLLIVAGAGTGKTTAITRRVAYLIQQDIQSESILALAFGEKAAEEMAERVEQLLPTGYLNLQISTFHAFCDEILKQYGLEIGLPDFEILDEVGQWLLVKNNLDKFRLDYYRPIGNPTRFIKALVNHFARAKDELVGPEDYLDYSEKLRLSLDQAEAGTKQRKKHEDMDEQQQEVERVEEVAHAYHIYQRLLLENNYLDFGDLISYCLNLLNERPKILKKLREQYQYILVDEFQDTNYAQYELVKLLAAPKNNLTVVGDDDQSIYKFRGASISNILHFRKEFKNAQSISLTRNYRNSQKILDLAYHFIKQNDPDRLEVKLKIPKKLVAQHKHQGEIKQLVSPHFIAEAVEVVNQIIKLKNSESDSTWNDFAILARSHDSLKPFIEKLESQALPFIYFANRGLYQKPIILDLFAYFRLLDDPHQNQDLYRVIKLPVFDVTTEGIIELSHVAKRKAISLYEGAVMASSLMKLKASDKSGIQKLMMFLEKHRKLARDKSTMEVFVQLISDLEFVQALEVAEFSNTLQEARHLEALGKKIQEFQAVSEDKSLHAFMEQIDFERTAGATGELEFDPDAGPEAIKLLTVHGAKGLEFKHVFMVGLVDKRFPSIERREPIELPEPLIKDILPEGNIHLEEERRLFYVGMTRAKNNLYFSRALDYGGKLTKKPSRFLVELDFAREEKSQPSGEVKLDKSKLPKAKLPLPKSFSFSQISLYRRCPLEYKYRYILGIPTPGAPQLSFGLTIHNTLEKYLRLILQTNQNQDLFGGGGERYELPNFETLKKIYEQSWIDDWYQSKEQKEEYRNLGKTIIKTFFNEAKKAGPTPKYLEKSFKLHLGKYWFTGKVDRADQTQDGLVVIDYKTGDPRKLGSVDKQQLMIYQWAMEEQFGETVSSLQYWYLKDKLKKEEFLGNREQLNKTKENILGTIEEIVAATETDGFGKADLKVAHECKYREIIK